MLESNLAKELYVGNGVTTRFPFHFKVWETSQLEVTVQDADGKYGVVTGWSATLTDTGGTVTYETEQGPLPEGWKLAITRTMPFTQDVDLITGTRFDPAVIEERLDRDCAERQELREKIERAIVFSATAEKIPSAEQYIEQMQDSFAARDEACQCAREAEAALEAIPPVLDNALQKIETAGDIQRERLDNIEDIILSTHGKSYQEVTWKLLTPIVKDEVFTLPAELTYMVGRNQVRITYDGVFLSKTFWEEVGELDAVSNQIKFLTAFAEMTEFTVWIGSLDNTEENAERAETAAQAAETAVETAQAKIDSAADGIRSEVQEEVDRAVQAAETAETAAGKINEIETTVNNAVAIANEASETATSAMSTANTAAATANGVDAKASSAVATATSAESKASEALSKAEEALAGGGGIKEIPIATTSTVGGIKPGAEMSVTTDGTLDDKRDVLYMSERPTSVPANLKNGGVVLFGDASLGGGSSSGGGKDGANGVSGFLPDWDKGINLPLTSEGTASAPSYSTLAPDDGWVVCFISLNISAYSANTNLTILLGGQARYSVFPKKGSNRVLLPIKKGEAVRISSSVGLTSGEKPEITFFPILKPDLTQEHIVGYINDKPVYEIAEQQTDGTVTMRRYTKTTD